MEFIDAQVKVGIEATKSLRFFYEEYNFEEEDFDFDTAYRYWKRFKTKKNKTIPLNYMASSVLHSSNNCRIILDTNQAETISEQFNKLTKYLFPSLPSKLPSQMRYYIHYNYSNYTLQEVQAILSAPSFQIIAYGNQAAKNTIAANPQLNEVLKYCIEQELI